jgi:hypothetical protein
MNDWAGRRSHGFPEAVGFGQGRDQALAIVILGDQETPMAKRSPPDLESESDVG